MRRLLSGGGAAACSLACRCSQHAAVNVGQWFHVGQHNVLIDFVDGGVGRAQFNHLGADLGNKAAIAGAATGRQLGLQAGFGADGGLRGFHQITGRGQERLAREAPGQVVLERAPVEYGLDALLEGLGRVPVL